MAVLVKAVRTDNTFENKEVMKILYEKLDEAIDDMEVGNVMSINDAWIEIDAI